MNMEIFRNSEFGSIRVIEEDGKYLFCGSDVAKALGYSNPRKAVRDHARGGTKRSIPTASGDQTMTFLPEGDVYRLIVHSRLPGAERFEKWVFDEVLPTIRRTGGYESMFQGLVRKYNKHHKPDEALPNITPHTMRHTFCTRLAQAGMNPKDLQYIMGHSNIAMTLNYYAHADYASAKAAMDKLAA